MENSVDQQNARAYARERFLRIISQLNGKECRAKMYESTEVSFTTRAFDVNMDTVVVKNLQTPLPKTIDDAIIRCNDIISLHYKL